MATTTMSEEDEHQYQGSLHVHEDFLHVDEIEIYQSQFRVDSFSDIYGYGEVGITEPLVQHLKKALAVVQNKRLDDEDDDFSCINDDDKNKNKKNDPGKFFLFSRANLLSVCLPYYRVTRAR